METVIPIQLTAEELQELLPGTRVELIIPPEIYLEEDVYRGELGLSLLQPLTLRYTIAIPHQFRDLVDISDVILHRLGFNLYNNYLGSTTVRNTHNVLFNVYAGPLLKQYPPSSILDKATGGPVKWTKYSVDLLRTLDFDIVKNVMPLGLAGMLPEHIYRNYRNYHEQYANGPSMLQLTPLQANILALPTLDQFYPKVLTEMILSYLLPALL